MKGTVFVGLSGGVDSAVSAALLQREGYSVVGAFIKIWSPEFLECTWKEDRLDAMRVCVALQIPFKEIDLSEEYKREVVAAMVSDYEKGITPNPDVLCNRSIKFGHFTEWALEQGAEHIATGHYARISKENDAYALLRGADANKDQSYFLYRLKQEDLSKISFPVGGYKKSDVRTLAKKFNLPNAARPDSQGLCFVGDVSLKDFLGRFIELQKGDVMDMSGNIVGKHDGAALYTPGERHGFMATGGTPYYVIDVDIQRNVVRVSHKKEDAASMSVSLADVNIVSNEHVVSGKVEAQARYREKPFTVCLEKRDASDASLDVRFDEPRIAARGQSLVLYDGEKCLGGGIINRKS